nr:nucleotidyl transferase AbiEii/AbiGii toxin family protein [Rhizobium wenxiniae]
MSQWESLFDQSVSIINQANSSFKLLDSWTFGGGTALMLQISHRESFDIDIFIDDPQVLPYLNPTTHLSLTARPNDEHGLAFTALSRWVTRLSGQGKSDFLGDSCRVPSAG